MTCPKCGSPDAVSKAEAWDALTQVPPATVAELAVMKNLFSIASSIARTAPERPDSKVLCYSVRARLIDDLKAAVRILRD